MADTLVTVLTRVDNYLQDGSNHQVKSRRGRPKYEIRWLGPQTSGYRKTRVKLQTLYDRRNQLSRDFRHRTTTEIVKRAIAGGNDLIVTEDLQIAGMTRSARGTESDPGRNVRAKSALNRRILQQGWGNVQEMLDYKAARAASGCTPAAPPRPADSVERETLHPGYPRLNSGVHTAGMERTRTPMLRSTSETGDYCISGNVWGRPRSPSGWTAWARPSQRVEKAGFHPVPVERPSPKLPGAARPKSSEPRTPGE